MLEVRLGIVCASAFGVLSLLLLASFFFALQVDSTLKHSSFNCSLYVQEKVEEGGVENWKNDKNELYSNLQVIW